MTFTRGPYKGKFLVGNVLDGDAMEIARLLTCGGSKATAIGLGRVRKATFTMRYTSLGEGSSAKTVFARVEAECKPDYACSAFLRPRPWLWQDRR
jgi:hypothetical protein